MKKINIISVTITGILLLSSCKGFLDLTPSQSIPTDKSISTVAEAGSALNGIYSRMTSSNYYGRRMLGYGDLKGGDFGIPTAGISDDAMYVFSHEQDKNTNSGFWTTIYDVILQTNNIITNIENGSVQINDTKEQKALDNVKGQALAIRALAHFDLVRLYGYPYLKDQGASLGVPVVTTVLDAYAKPKRNTVAEVYIQIIQDLKDAIHLLSNDKTLGSINSWGAKTLLARAYLYKGDWENAYLAAKDVITNSGYEPYTAANWAASWSKQGSSESMFELIILANESDLGNSSPRSFFYPRNVIKTYLGAAVASDIFLNMFKQYPDDCRWEMLGLDEFGNELSQGREIPGRRGWMKKYEGDGKTPLSACNIKILRLSEAYLIGAEAAIKKPEKDLVNGVAWLNTIRARNPALTALSTSEPESTLLEEVALERRKEFLGEGQTYFDILRNGGTVHYDGPVFFGEPTVPLNGRSLTVDWNYYKCVLPISIDELNANSEMQQNPKY